MSFYKYPQFPVTNYYVLKHRTRRSNQFCNPAAYFRHFLTFKLFYIYLLQQHIAAHIITSSSTKIEPPITVIALPVPRPPPPLSSVSTSKSSPSFLLQLKLKLIISFCEEHLWYWIMVVVIALFFKATVCGIKPHSW